MWFKAFVYFLVALILQACAADSVSLKYPKPLAPAVTLHGDTSYTAPERKAIEKAADIWREQTGGQANIKIVWDRDPSAVKVDTEHTLRKSSSDDLQVVLIDCMIAAENDLPPCMPTLLGWVDIPGGIHNHEHEPVSVNFIPDRYETESKFVSVAIHEFGHLLGLPHQNVTQAVMYPTQNAEKTCLKPSDLASFCSVNVCDGRKMYPCE